MPLFTVDIGKALFPGGSIMENNSKYSSEFIIAPNKMAAEAYANTKASQLGLEAYVTQETVAHVDVYGDVLRIER
jgi:hypothetical protein